MPRKVKDFGDGGARFDPETHFAVSHSWAAPDFVQPPPSKCQTVSCCILVMIVMFASTCRQSKVKGLLVVCQKRALLAV